MASGHLQTNREVSMPAAAIEIDQTDAEILRLLQTDGSLSYHEIGKKVDLSVTAVNYRIKKLFLQGILLKTVALINPDSVGLDVLAFVLMRFVDFEKEKKVITTLLRRPEIQECHRISGEYSYLLKIRTHTIQDLEKFVDQHARPALGKGKVAVLMVLSSQKQTTEMPL